MTRDYLKIFILSLNCAAMFFTATTVAQENPPPISQVLADHCMTCQHSTCEGDFPDSDPNCLKPRVNWTLTTKYVKCYNGQPLQMFCSDRETMQLDKKDQNGNPCKRIERGCGERKVLKWPCQKVSRPEYVSVTYQCYTTGIGWFPCNEYDGYPTDRLCKHVRSNEESGTLRTNVIDKSLVMGIIVVVALLLL